MIVQYYMNIVERPTSRETERPRKPRSQQAIQDKKTTRSQVAKKPRNRKTKKPRKPGSHTRTEGKIYTPSHEVTRSRGAKKLRNRETKKPRKPRSLKEPKAQRPRAHPDQKTKIPPKKKKSQNKYASCLKHAPSFGDSASSLTRARIRR